MKRKMFVFSLLALFLWLLTLCVHPAWAAGTVTQTLTGQGRYIDLLTYSWTGDASNGSVPATESQWPIDGYIIMVVTNPGSPAPTDNYDITLTDTDGVDTMGGELTDRDTVNSEQAVPKIGSVYGTRWVSGKITLNITNQSVAGAKGVVKVYIWPGR